MKSNPEIFSMVLQMQPMQTKRTLNQQLDMYLSPPVEQLPGNSGNNQSSLYQLRNLNISLFARAAKKQYGSEIYFKS